MYIVVSENDCKIIIAFGDNQSFYHTIVITNSKYFFSQCAKRRVERERNRETHCSRVVPEGGAFRAKLVLSERLDAFPMYLFSKLPSRRAQKS